MLLDQPSRPGDRGCDYRWIAVGGCAVRSGKPSREHHSLELQYSVQQSEDGEHELEPAAHIWCRRPASWRSVNGWRRQRPPPSAGCQARHCCLRMLVPTARWPVAAASGWSH
jgi:hypothetical protein